MQFWQRNGGKGTATLVNLTYSPALILLPNNHQESLNE
jgi:hypothetical protein